MGKDECILITGGAGFIGSHLADELLDHGYRVRVLDNLSPQVHGDTEKPPSYLNPGVEFMKGDVRDPEAVGKALRSVRAVFHFAAAVGVGQSMYEIGKYTSVNNLGTAILLEQLVNRPVERLIVASSMSVYGEGMYRDGDGSPRNGVERSLEQLKQGRWEPVDGDGHVLTSIPTPESKALSLASVYALSKYDQERMCLMVGRAYHLPVVALRFFNVFGPRQSLSNPYTGVLAIFASRLLNGKPPVIFEDGEQKRDFVSVYDVARACRAALEAENSAGEVLNIGSGRCYTVREVAERMAAVLNRGEIQPEITGRYRVGDIRHCYADISRACKMLGYAPRIMLEEGVAELAEWLSGQRAHDRFETAAEELAKRGLTV